MNDTIKKIPITVLGLKILENERNNLKNVDAAFVRSKICLK